MIKPLQRWTRKVLKSFTKNFPLSLLSILLLPLFIWTMQGTLLQFGLFAWAGYLISCIWKLDKLIADIKLSIIWGLGYILSTIAFTYLIRLGIPELTKGNTTSIFAGIVIIYILIKIWKKGQQLKK